jgi:hypothetical protein
MLPDHQNGNHTASRNHLIFKCGLVRIQEECRFENGSEEAAANWWDRAWWVGGPLEYKQKLLLIKYINEMILRYNNKGEHWEFSVTRTVMRMSPLFPLIGTEFNT